MTLQTVPVTVVFLNNTQVATVQAFTRGGVSLHVAKLKDGRSMIDSSLDTLLKRVEDDFVQQMVDDQPVIQ